MAEPQGSSTSAFGNYNALTRGAALGRKKKSKKRRTGKKRGGLVSIGLIAIVAFLFDRQEATAEDLDDHEEMLAHPGAAEELDRLDDTLDTLEDDVAEIKGDVKLLLERTEPLGG